MKLKKKTGTKKYGFTTAVTKIKPKTLSTFCIESRRDFGIDSSTALKFNLKANIIDSILLFIG